MRLDEPVSAPIRGRIGPCAWWHFGLEPVSGDLVLVNFARTRATARHAFEAHRSSVHELILVRRGPYHARIEGVRVEMGPGTALLVAPGELHEDIYERGAFAYGLQFAWRPLGRRHWLGENLFAGKPGERSCTLPAGFPWGALERWNPMAETSEPFAEVRMRLGLLEALYAALLLFKPGLLRLTPVGAGRVDGGFRRRLESVFAAALSRAPSVAELSAAMGMKADRFAHECTRLLGAPPRKAHLRFRLDHARSRLLTDDRPIAEISEDFGFASPFHFSRAFRAFFGYPPSQLRRGARP